MDFVPVTRITSSTIAEAILGGLSLWKLILEDNIIMEAPIWLEHNQVVSNNLTTGPNDTLHPLSSS